MLLRQDTTYRNVSRSTTVLYTFTQAYNSARFVADFQQWDYDSGFTLSATNGDWTSIWSVNNIYSWIYDFSGTNITAGAKVSLWTNYWWKAKSAVYVPKPLYKGVWKIDMQPKEIKAIWSLMTWFIYWLDEDWIYKWWIITWKTSSATAWSITLGNAVWYLTVLVDWEVLKIPYYY